MASISSLFSSLSSSTLYVCEDHFITGSCILPFTGGDRPLLSIHSAILSFPPCLFVHGSSEFNIVGLQAEGYVNATGVPIFRGAICLPIIDSQVSGTVIWCCSSSPLTHSTNCYYSWSLELFTIFRYILRKGNEDLQEDLIMISV